MKNKIFFMALVALIIGTFSSCKKDQVQDNYPILYVVNGTDYSVEVYCDNRFVATAEAHNNSGKVELSNISINLPVYVEAEFYDKQGDRIGNYKWNNFYFRWNKSYKMTLTNSSSTTSLMAY